MKNLTEILVLVVYLAIVFTLVRPKSQGPQLVSAAGNAFSSVLKSATGGGTF